MTTVEQRTKPFKRKEAARRKLLDSISTRNRVAKCGVQIVQTERKKREFQFPRFIDPREDNIKTWKHHYSGGNKNSRCKSTRNHNVCMNIEEKSQRRVSRKDTSGCLRKTYSQNISLQEIIMDFNTETSIAIGNIDFQMTSPCSFTELYEEDRAFGTPYEETLYQNKYNKFNPCQSRYRPITPGLLETMNDRKLPSSVKTEQWVTSSRNAHRCHVYKTENLDYTNWIYDDL